MNMQNLMAQAQKLQRDMAKKKEEIDKTLFPGKSEWVELVFNGKKELVSITIEKSKEINSEEDIEILEDMIKIAVKDALSKVDKETEEKMGVYAQSMNGLM